MHKGPLTVTLSIVMACWLLIGMACSLSEWMYAIRSTSGMRKCRPGVRIRLNLPNRSITHADCCGTIQMP